MEPGPFGQLFKLLLGSRRGPDGRHEGAPQQPENREHDHWPHNERSPRDEADLYKVFTNPLEMNRFFEEQMDEMLRNFGQGFFGGDLRSGPPGPFGGRLQPALPHADDENGSKRDLMLRDPKHSSAAPPPAESLRDEDLSDNWQSLLGGKRQVGTQGQLFGTDEDSGGVSPLERRDLEGPRSNWDRFGGRGFRSGTFNFGNQGPDMEQFQGEGRGGGVRFFSSSVSESTVRGPDGGLETTRTVRSSDGREEVTVIKQLPDGSSRTETRVTEGNHKGSKEEGWSLVPRGGLEVPGPREEMLGQKPESVLDELWQTFFGK